LHKAIAYQRLHNRLHSEKRYDSRIIASDCTAIIESLRTAIEDTTAMGEQCNSDYRLHSDWRAIAELIAERLNSESDTIAVPAG
jgi:hypothetical protein